MRTSIRRSTTASGRERSSCRVFSPRSRDGAKWGWRLLIAAVAERHELTLLHYDADFDTIAEITGQDARWVVPRAQTP